MDSTTAAVRTRRPGIGESTSPGAAGADVLAPAAGRVTLRRVAAVERPGGLDPDRGRLGRHAHAARPVIVSVGDGVAEGETRRDDRSAPVSRQRFRTSSSAPDVPTIRAATWTR